MSYEAQQETMPNSGRPYPVWPERTQDDWNSMREKVRMSGTQWDEEDENPATAALRYRLAPASPALDAVPATGIAGVFQQLDRLITKWEHLPERIQRRILIITGVSSVLLFIYLAATIS
jgi:hypothetical protein